MNVAVLPNRGGAVAPSRRGAPPELPCCLPGSGTFSPRSGVVGGSNGRICVTAPLQDAFTDPVSDLAGGGATHASAVDASRAQRATLLERRQELARIESALADARSGQGRFVVVEGPAGIGKTALLAAARLAATDGGMRVLRARGTEMERDFAFGVVRQLFEPRLADALDSDRSDLLQGAAGVAARILGLPGAPAPDASEDSTVDPTFAVLHGLYWLCANLAADEPLCLIVDDAHWMDGPSRRYLSFLLTRLDELQVALVLATRPYEPGSDAELLAALTADPAADLIQLPPLTGAAIAELVNSDLGSAPDPSFVDACLRATGGTPFLVRVLLDALKEGSIEPTSDAWRHVERIGARTAGRSINIRLRRLPEPAGQLAHALALLEQSTLLEASQVAGLDVDEAADAAQILESAGILETDRPLRFVHPLIRSGIYAELPRLNVDVATGVLHTYSRSSREPRSASRSICCSATPREMPGQATSCWRRPPRRQVTARPSPRRHSCGGRSPSPRPPRSSRRSCSIWGWPRPARARPAGTIICNRLSIAQRTPRRPPPRRWCSVSLSAGHSARGRLSRFSIALPRRSMRATRHSHSWQGVRLSSPR